ncbi:MAG: NAD(P)/FAD-dependent oxidoreductase [Thiohalomonadales bacterium]
MCAIEAAKRGRKVLVLDHANKAGKKILMSGGGRCNFTNYSIAADNYISHNPHFCKSALSRYTQWDFIELVNRYKIEFHERSHGQLFCDNSAKDILRMLLTECEQAGVSIHLNTKIDSIEKKDNESYLLSTRLGPFSCQSLVVASGGLSIPTLGASPYGYQIAEKFNINVWPTAAGLVPFTLQTEDKERFAGLSGIAIDSTVSNDRQNFHENLLFTHRGLSGPAILQLSSYWRPGEEIHIDLLPDKTLFDELKLAKHENAQLKLKNALSKYLPKRLVSAFLDDAIRDKILQSFTDLELREITSCIKQWRIKPGGTEGYRTAEVTLGGVDCNALSSKTMQCVDIEGLYFIGEVVDVTGWLGGYNFQWAWSSAWCAGQYV